MTEFAERFAAAREYARARPGLVGIAVLDRADGTLLRNNEADTHVWACSTPKLAMVVDLLLRNDSGAVMLDESDRVAMRAMLHSSDDASATALWRRHGGETGFAPGFRRYGMTGMHFTDERPHTWGWIRATAIDLAALMRYVLEDLPAAHRRYIVHEMRSVHPNQRWGVWDSGVDAGVKNGWSDDDPGGAWVMNTVGFAGEGERFVVAVTNATGISDGGFATGAVTVTRVAAILLG